MDVWGITVVGYLMSLVGASGGGPGCVALAGLDLQRSVAWSSGSHEAVERLYADPSAAAGDVEALQQWTNRGLELESAMLVIGSCTASPEPPAALGTVRLTVVDRLAPTRAVDALGIATALPVDTWSDRQVVLRQQGDTWRYVEVTVH